MNLQMLQENTGIVIAWNTEAIDLDTMLSPQPPTVDIMGECMKAISRCHVVSACNELWSLYRR